MTEVVKWRDPLTKYFRVQLPEPPRYHHLSKSVRPPKDKIGRDLEDWLGSVAVTTTVDAD
jgi:hypothetical protein